MTGLAISAPRDPVLYVVGALVPLALLLVYWLWIEPRADAEHLRARRLGQAVEEAFELTHPQADASTPRDTARRAYYDRLDISDLFEPDHIEAASALDEAHDAGKSLQARLNAEADPSPALIAEIQTWEERTANEIEGDRGSADALSFRHPTGTGPSPSPTERRERLEKQLVLVELWVGDERKRAGEQAKDRYR